MKILTNKHISMETRKRALQCYIESVLMYGCKAWTISKQIQNKLEATEMWFPRRMLRIPWTAKKTNERVLNEANKRRTLVRTIRKRQATFLGHVMRRGKLEHLVTTGKFEGKRTRGRLSQCGLAITPFANTGCNWVGTVMNETFPIPPTQHSFDSYKDKLKVY
ncbi:hypothetical protein PoB_004333900 [Plakobranchus ocellatus]|uniref:Reverse transcriptase domain-containing protein n=1 Tax=Plakobranchus ocellatus TaxID=259542 RepID=A0AAV4B9M7_9GAST|nr:hypothetical protein PoB_004333900 [Plakobranchus ocellatus]